MATPNLFGVTAAMLRRTYFAHLSDFSVDSVPTAAAVSEEIARKAARLYGRLAKEAIDASLLTDAASVPYLICQDLLLLEAAISVHGLLSGQAPELLKAWEERLSRRYRELEAEGYSSLGSPAPAQEPDGPDTHIDGHGLELEDEADISPVTHKLRASDLL